MLGTSKSIWDFDPRTVPGCGLWLDGADRSSMTISSSSVTQWNDKSGNGYNFVTQGSFAAPVISNNAVGSLSAVSFTGNSTQNNTANQILTNASFPLNSSAAGYSIFAVSRQNASAPSYTGYNYILSAYGGTAGNGLFYGTVTTTKFFLTANGTAGPLSGFNDLTANVPNTLMTTLNQTGIVVSGSVLTPYLNGLAMTAKTGTCVALTGISVGNAYAPGGGNFTGQTWGGIICEVLIYNSALTTTQRQQVEGYLSRKWGITLQNLLVPLTVSNCVLWLDADDSTKFTGGTTWLDKSGTNNHGINGTPGISTMPTVTTWTNGRKAARFVLASKNSMKTTNSIANFASYFMVARIQAAVGYGMLIINNLDGQRQFVMNTTSFPVALFWYPGGTSINLGSFVQGQGFVFCGTVTSGSGVGHMNGVQVGSNTNPNTSGSSQNYFGSANGDGGYLTIDIAEIIIYTGVVSSTDRQSIENYLSAKWNIPLSRSGVTLHPFNSIRPFLRQFNPIDISGCQLWFDAADRSTITLSSGTTVSSWRDKSINISSTTSVAGTNALTQNAMNGRPAILLNGSSSFTGSTTGSGNTLTVCIVATQSNTCATNGGLVCFGRPGFDDWNDIGSLSITNFVGVGSGQMGSTRTANSQTVNTGVSTPFIYILVFDGTFVNSYLNGTIQTPTNISLTGTFAYTGYKIGTRAGATVNVFWTGFIGEVIVYNTGLTTNERQQVEGYLAYKWGLISPLPATHSYKKLPPSSSLPFSPTNISGCQIWLDAADSSYLILSGSNLTQWNDKSGNARNMTVYAGTPVFNTNPSRITFNGSTSLINTTFTSQIFTLFIVYLQTTASGPLYTTSTTQEYSGFWPNEGGTTYLTRMDGNSWYTEGSQFSINTQRIVVIQYTAAGAGGSIFVWSNGTLKISTTTLAARTVTSLLLGSRPSTNGFINGYYNEVIQYDSVLTTSQRQQVEGYLAEKWGLKSSLPSTHLYRSFPPSFVTPIVAASSSSIVTTNLIVNLDPVSYTASSTSWPATVGNTWTFSSAPSIVSTTTSVALSFNGSQYVMDQTGFTTGPASTSSFTIEVWFYAASGLTNNIISEMGQSGGPGGGWNVSMMYIVSSTIQAAFWVGGVYTLSLGSYSANTWTHACYTYSGTTVTGYKNGVSVATGTASKQYPGRGYYCLAGAGNPIYSSTACRIGGFRIYSSPLSAAQVTQNYNAYAPRFGLSTI